MHRRYNRWHSRFDQPGPYGGSYDITNPQSFNRYSYVLNDPVNFVDPSGLDDEFTCRVGDPGCAVGSVTINISGGERGTGVGGTSSGPMEIETSGNGPTGAEIVPQNSGRRSEAEHDILGNDLNRHLSFRKDCIDFVQALLRTVGINTQRPAYDDLMDVFDEVRKQGGVVVDAAVGRRGHSSEAHGAISGNSATLRVASISFAEGEVMSAARGQVVLAETLHFAAKQGVFTDSELVWAGYQVAWAQGYSVAPPPATNDTEKNSNYFHNTLQFAACNSYQKKK